MDKENKNIEYRTLGNLELRDADNSNSRTIYGRAVVFNSLSQDLGGFKEIIEPTAITDDVIKNSDIFATLDHDTSRGILARCKNGEGSLNLELRDDGLWFSFEAPNTALGDEVLEYIRRGEINSCSFAFTCGDIEDDDNWIRKEDGMVYRTIHHIDQLFDVSVVFNPAYTQTVASIRKLQKFKEDEAEKKLQESQLIENYDKMIDEFKNL